LEQKLAAEKRQPSVWYASNSSVHLTPLSNTSQPILQALLANPSPLFALVLAPTRELAYQISQQFEALGSIINVRCATIVGGMDMVSQSVARKFNSL
jgi:hypothetical protein